MGVNGRLEKEEDQGKRNTHGQFADGGHLFDQPRC